jgi:hypothetical protein
LISLRINIKKGRILVFTKPPAIKFLKKWGLSFLLQYLGGEGSYSRAESFKTGN